MCGPKPSLHVCKRAGRLGASLGLGLGLGGIDIYSKASSHRHERERHERARIRHSWAKLEAEAYVRLYLVVRTMV